jgi:hypothetical protein
VRFVVERFVVIIADEKWGWHDNIVANAILIYVVVNDAIVRQLVVRTAFVAITVINVRTVVYATITRVAVDVSIVKRLVVESFTVVAVRKRSSSHPQCH